MIVHKLKWQIKISVFPFWQRGHLNTGRVLGGRSTVSSMVYLRGSGKNYNLWERLGGAGWGFRDVIPYFLKQENFRIEEFQTSGKLQCIISFLLNETVMVPVPMISFFFNSTHVNLYIYFYHFSVFTYSKYHFGLIGIIETLLRLYKFKLVSGGFLGVRFSVYISSWMRVKYRKGLNKLSYNFMFSFESISFHKRPCNGQRWISDTPSTSRHLPESVSDTGA